MKAFDTDILTEILVGNPAYAERIAKVPVAEQIVPIVAIEEILRGRLHAIRQAEAAKGRITIEQAYVLFERTLDDLREVKILSFTEQAEALLKEWRKRKIRGSTHDLRIAASCVVSSATLVTRNRRDFQNIPGLSVEFWD
ncbi:MAG TPA: PIN domain-containing protein [Gemmataceae bacterium]|jgi:tRNA(fMet)-specific endonuclease VapC